MLVLSVLLSAVALLLTAMYVQFRWRHRHVLAAAAKLPCPPALPLLGNAHFFIGGITSLIKDLILFTKNFKQLFCIWIGPVPIFVISDPSDVQVIAVHFLRKYKITSQVRLEDIEYEFKVVTFSKTPLLLDLEPRTDVAS